jgi:hypothetical protein
VLTVRLDPVYKPLRGEPGKQKLMQQLNRPATAPQ